MSKTIWGVLLTSNSILFLWNFSAALDFGEFWIFESLAALCSGIAAAMCINSILEE